MSDLHHTPQEVREIVAWQRYQEQRTSSKSQSWSSATTSFKSDLMSKSERKQKIRQMSEPREEVLYSNTEFHQAPEGIGL